MVLAAALAGLIVGLPSVAGENIGSTRAVAERFLDNLVGEWQISRKIRGQVVGNTLHASWVLQHRFVQLHMRDVKEPSEYEALVTIGYEEKGGRFVAYWCDSFGPDYAGVGAGKRAGNAVEFTFNYPEGPFHNTFTWDSAASQWTFLMESEMQGRRVLFAEDTVRKR